jgi:mannosyltransferase
MGKKQKILLAIIILSAATLRLLAILHVGDFTWDEMFSFTYSQKPWLDSLTFWTWETNPPLHLIFLKLWFYIFPADEFWQRIPSLIFGVITVWWVYKIGRDYFHERVGQISAILLALHPYHIFISTFGRAYSLLLCLTAISIYYFLKIFVKNEFSKKDLIILAAINLLISYAHLTGFFILMGCLSTANE